MRSIRRKLTVNSMLIVLFSILFVSVPMLVTQVQNLNEDLKENADAKAGKGTSEINLFFEKAVNIVDNLGEYVKSHDPDSDACQKMFTGIVNSDDDFQLLYYGSTKPRSRGGGNVFCPADRRWCGL